MLGCPHSLFNTALHFEFLFVNNFFVTIKEVMMMTLGNAPFNLIFHLEDGLCPERESSKRYLSDVKNIFYDTAAAEKVLANDNQLIYEFYELPMPHDGGDLAFGTSITYPGTIGGEYFMTKGHFHSILNTAEVYYCLNGHGMMMMENSDGQWECRELDPGTALYVPKGFAHRSINIGTRPLATFFCFRADAGHDYKTIANQGFRHLVVERNGRPAVIENPRWQAV
jgi:glucose-6-phosphate isomerase